MQNKNKATNKNIAEIMPKLQHSVSFFKNSKLNISKEYIMHSIQYGGHAKITVINKSLN